MTLTPEIITTATHPLESVIKAGGIVGLIAVMGMIFLMVVVYRGQINMQDVHMELVDLERQIVAAQLKTNEKLDETNRVLTDMRYSIKASNGISFRNSSTN